MESITDILSKFNPKEDRYVSREYQSFGVFLAQKLGDEKRKGLYIKYAKEIPRPILEQAYRFVIDSNARNKGALFNWKLKELKVFEKFKLSSPVRKKSSKKSTPVSEKPPKSPRRKKSNVDTLF